ncbi:hypothetical protein ACFYNF_13165 [Streptomyces sp. NPDC006641]|uniref:hypothetical protein n=1 Tax=unclassified Streptomyces TaxID=2593676 RepID=UPI0036C761C6
MSEATGLQVRGGVPLTDLAPGVVAQEEAPLLIPEVPDLAPDAAAVGRAVTVIDHHLRSLATVEGGRGYLGAAGTQHGCASQVAGLGYQVDERVVDEPLGIGMLLATCVDDVDSVGERRREKVLVRQ